MRQPWWQLHGLWQLCVFGVPLLFIVTISFWSLKSFEPEPDWQPENYLELLREDRYRQSLMETVRLGCTVGAIGAILGLGAAVSLFAIENSKARWALLGAVLFPFFSNLVLRMFGWQLWLSGQWVPSVWLRGGGAGLLFTRTGVIVGLVSAVLPLTTALVFITLSAVEKSWIDAARNLGAGRLDLFRKLELPYALPGTIAAFAVAAVIAIGDQVAGSVLGGSGTYTLAMAIGDRIKIGDWPRASGLGVFLLGLSIIFLFVAFQAVRSSPALKRWSRK